MPHFVQKLLPAVGLLLWSLLSRGQDLKAAQPFEKNVLNGNLLGTSSVIGVSYERFVSPRTTLEFGLGLIGIGAGFSYYLTKPQARKVCPYIGAKMSSGVLVDVGGGYVAYLPVGLNFFTEWKVNVGVDVGPAYGFFHESNFDGPTGRTTRIPFYGNLRLGYRFSD